MALWDKIRSRGNVEDRRGMGPVGIGGLGATGIGIVLLLTVLGGGDLTDVLDTVGTLPLQESPQNAEEFAGEDEYEVFASTVLGSNNELWRTIFRERNDTYTEPRLVLFRTATNSGCGTATSQVGPHYCPLDNTIYLDETFFDELQNRFGAEGGDVAEAYVIAHEVGHHAQNALGIMERARNTGTQEAAINLELQADCFAGLWAHSIKDRGVFLPNEIHEAIDAAEAVGDDRIQERVTGQINPETWTHGSSEQRKSWFNRGYESGDVNTCDTFRN